MFSSDVIGFSTEEELTVNCERHRRDNTVISVVFHDVQNGTIPLQLDYDITFYDNNIKWNIKELFYKSTSKYIPYRGKKILKYFLSCLV